jgi:hypothetical protein
VGGIRTAIGRWGKLEDTVAHELPQMHRKNVPGDARASLKLAKPPHPVERIPNNQERPPVANGVQGPGNRAGVASRLKKLR